jgi:twinkle protein
MELPAIKAALAHRAEEVCKHLLPGGKIDKHDYVCGDLSGTEGKSLKIALNGSKAGIWRDFAGEIGGSNLLELWVQVRRAPFREALAEVKAWLETKGVRQDKAEARAEKKRSYAKPEKKGVTWICDKAQFYLNATRQIPKDIIAAYKIAGNVEQDAIVFPYLSEQPPLFEAQMIKWLKLERDEKGKKVTWTSANTAKVLFGKHTVRPGDRFLCITEGEMDAMSVAALGIPDLCCTSVPFGAKWAGKDGRDPNDEWIENDWDFLTSFERIYLCFDNDEEGKKARASIVTRLGRELCWVVDLPEEHKDANEMLCAGKGELVKHSFACAKTIDPAELKNASEYRHEAIEALCSPDANQRKGIPLPFGAYPFHIRWNEATVVTGINGSGKSVVLNFLCLYLWKQGHPCAIASLEVPPVQSLQCMILQTMGRDGLKHEEASRACDWIERGVWFFNHVGSIKYKDLLKTFRYAFRRYGCRIFVIDSFMACGIAEDDLTAQQVFANDIADFVNELPVHVFVVAHPRKGSDTDKVINKMDVKGSGGLTDRFHNVVIFHRNRKKSKAIEKMVKFKEDETKITALDRTEPDNLFIVEKQRNDKGDEPTIDLWFRPESKQFFGWYMPKGKPFSFLEAEAPPPPPTEVQPSGQPVEEDVPF